MLYSFYLMIWALSLSQTYATSLTNGHRLVNKWRESHYASRYIPQSEHIQVSRHRPSCVIFAHYGEEYPVQQSICKLFQNNIHEANYSSWAVGSFAVDKAISPPLQLPYKVPTLRCYLGLAEYHDYDGNNSRKQLQHWFSKLVAVHSKQLPEATLANLDHSIHEHTLTLVGFSNLQQHVQIEELLIQVQESWKDVINVLFVHPDSSDARSVAKKLYLNESPTVVFIENSDKTQNEPVIKHTLRPFEISRRHIDLFLTLRDFPALTLSAENFDEIVLRKTKHYVPLLMLFYTLSSPRTLDYVRAFERVIQDMQVGNVNMRFAMMEVNNSVRHVFEKTVRAAYETTFPFAVLFSAKWNKTTVVGIKQMVISERPTPGVVAEALIQHQFVLRSTLGQVIDIKMPWGYFDPTEMTELFEGPYGSACTVHSSNATDNVPHTRSKHTSKSKGPSQHRLEKPWYNKYDSGEIDHLLEHLGTLPLLTGDTWKAVIEKSHAVLHPYSTHGIWRGEHSKVALIIFLLAGCGSCTRNLPVFEEIQKAIRHIDGGSTYLVNCSSDPDVCEAQGITGYPTLIGYRSLGWLNGQDCIDPNTNINDNYIRMDYHGVLLVADVMDWFFGITSEPVINLKFENPNKDHKFSVQLTATVLPRDSPYLPHISGQRTDYFYPYACYQLACERLYGQASCYVQYSSEVPQSQYTEDGMHMVVTKVALSRNDGIQATIVKLGRTLLSTLEDESSTNIHMFHRQHRYDLHDQQKCEDYHSACTDLIVRFVKDHGRLPVTQMTSLSFHTQQNLLFEDNLPVLVALVHMENITHNATLYKTLESIAYHYYNDLVVITVDVDEFPGWAGQFVPHGGRHKFKESDSHTFYHYPRLCVVNWNDHQHAAFFTPVKVKVAEDVKVTKDGIEIAEDVKIMADGIKITDDIIDREEHVGELDQLNEKDIASFLEDYFINPMKFIVETEHF